MGLEGERPRRAARHWPWSCRTVARHALSGLVFCSTLPSAPRVPRRFAAQSLLREGRESGVASLANGHTAVNGSNNGDADADSDDRSASTATRALLTRSVQITLCNTACPCAPRQLTRLAASSCHRPSCRLRQRQHAILGQPRVSVVLKRVAKKTGKRPPPMTHIPSPPRPRRTLRMAGLAE